MKKNSKVNKPKILFITDTFLAMAGAEKNVYTLATELNKRDYEPVVCCHRGGYAKTLLEEEGIRVLDLNIDKLYNINGIRQIFGLTRFLKKNRINLVSTYHEASDFLGILIKMLTGIPTVSNRRDMGYKLKKRHIMIYRIINHFFDKIVTVSQAVRNVIIARENAPSKKLIPIHNGLDLSLYTKNTNVQNIKSTFGISPTDKVIGMIATLRKIKDHTTLILAASIILKRLPNVKFLIVGHDNQETGYSFKNLKRLIDELGISEHIIYAGARHDIPKILSIIDVSVLSSLSEGFSNTILESMAAGKPVVATNVGGNPEAVIDGETGFLVPSKDPDALARALLELLEEPELAKRMGESGRERVESSFSLSLMINGYESLFKTLP